MERDARYALVGMISVLIFVLGVLSVMWLARFQFTRAYDVYDVDFKGPVRGLSTGGEVYFNGIKVGQVTRLRLDGRDPNRVMARIRIASDAPVRADSTASLEPLGVTGVSYVQLTAGALAKPLLKDVTPPESIPVIHGSQSRLESLLEGGGTVLARTVEALDRVNRLMSDANVASLSETLTNVREITGRIRDQRELLVDLDQTVRSVDAASRRIGDLADTGQALLNGPGRDALLNLSQTAVQIRGTAAELQTIVAGVATPAQAFATTDLPRLGRAVVSVQQAAENLDQLVGEIEQNPRDFVSKPPAKTLEVKP